MKQLVQAATVVALTSLLIAAPAANLTAQESGPGAASKETSIAVANALKGKKVDWIPLSMGYPLAEEWTRVMKENLEPLGIEITTHDANGSSDAQSQAFAALMPEHPDLIVVQKSQCWDARKADCARGEGRDQRRAAEYAIELPQGDICRPRLVQARVRQGQGAGRALRRHR